MNNKAFIQVGQWLFATAHIAAINLDTCGGLNGDHPAVSLYVDGNNDPWTFLHGTPEAEAIMAYAAANVEVLAPLDHEIK